jgi:hypothetical protein
MMCSGKKAPKIIIESMLIARILLFNFQNYFLTINSRSLVLNLYRFGFAAISVSAFLPISKLPQDVPLIFLGYTHLRKTNTLPITYFPLATVWPVRSPARRKVGSCTMLFP